MRIRLLLTLSIATMMAELCFANERFASDLTSQKVKLWTKNVWSNIEISDSANAQLFYPFNEGRIGFDNLENEYNLKLLESQKSAIQFNLWSIIIYHFFKGELTLHFSYDPNWYLTSDHGFLFYPFTAKNYGTSSKGNYFTDSLFRSKIIDFQLLTITDFSTGRVPIESIEFPGEDSMLNGNVIYYPREFTWYLDKDILYYQIREMWIMDESGSVVEQNIKAIAPFVNHYDIHGNLMGVRELFWLDFNQLEPLLANYFFVKKSESIKKVNSFSGFFLDRKFESTIILEDSVYVQKKGK